MRSVQPLAVLLTLLLAACGGTYDGSPGAGTDTPAAGGGGGQDDGGSAATTLDGFFTGNLQGALDNCRTCHVPDGVADSASGRAFMLSSDRSQDLANFRSSWQALGGGVDSSRILTMASGRESHSGGAPWPANGTTYLNARRVIQCFADPSQCSFTDGGGDDGSDGTGTALPLLGSQRGGHYWFDYCEGRPDDALLPQDPRELVVPGVNQGKAVLMNAYWQTCQSDNNPGTCGGLRQRVARGYPIVASDGEVGAGSFFSGSSADSTYAFPASSYNEMWQRIWRLSARPDNYDQLVAERWGMPLSPTRNPYPLPGE
ncbi:MAG: hypothetical protein VW625_07715, partial [Perlucidibaca sp.]